MIKNNNQRRLSGETYQLHPITAYLLIRTQGGDLITLIEKAKKLKHVKSTAIVAGDYDVIIRVNTPNLEQLMDVTDKIQSLNGVQLTSTHIIEKEALS